MLSLTDQTGRTISLNTPARRIVSLVPSQTELLSDLGLNEEVVGITKFCVHPKEWFQTKPRVGGTKQIHPDIIRRLNPDLIIANKEENVKEQIEELSADFPLWISDVSNLESAYQMINQVGMMTGKENDAMTLTAQIKTKFSEYQSCLPARRLRALYLIWQHPYMSVGGDTFIHSMMEAAGLQNIFADKCRYPELTISDLDNMSPALLLLSSEPFPFKQKHVDELQPHLPKTKIILVDGEMFSWYGSRLLEAPTYFKKLLEELNTHDDLGQEL